MSKIRITADAILNVLLSIFGTDEVNQTVDDVTAPKQWQGKQLLDCLNVHYYTFKHKPISSQQVFKQLLQETGTAKELVALNRSYCLCSISSLDRQYSKDIDMTSLTVSLEYWIQSDKIKLIEWLIENSNLGLSGLRIPVTIGTDTRQAVVIFSKPIVSDIQTTSGIGESALVDIRVDMILYPDASSYCNYNVSFDFTDIDGTVYANVALPLSSFAYVNAMTQKSVPQQTHVANVGNLNLSRGLSFNLVFDGYNNDFVNYLARKALQQAASQTSDINNAIVMHIERDGVVYDHTVIIKDHQVTVNNDTNNEVHQLSLVTQLDTLVTTRRARLINPNYNKGAKA